MKDGAVGLVEIPVTGDTLKLAPGLTTRMPIGADVPAAEPAIVGTIRIGTEVRSGVDSALASSRAGDKGRWQVGRHRAGSGPVRTGLAQRFMDEPGEGLGFFGASASALMGLEERLGRTG
jgi:hypothetical protein